ncbi:MAG: zf-TFIIB domain-containing protein [Planctomycetota bacterium]|jgi:Zn-finger nucleic acid-binding protein
MCNYAYDSNIFLDRCGKCKGIWLDPNEIIDIAKHIQYNPEMVAAARSMIKNEDADDQAMLYTVIMAIFIIIRLLILKF